MHFLPKFGIIGLLAAILFSNCVSTDNAYTRVAPGIWRGVLELDKFNVPVHDKDTIYTLKEQFREGELPFNFEVKYVDDENFYVEIINGSERIRCDSIRYGRDRSAARDTFNVYFPEYASYIHAGVRGGVMQGEWVVTTKSNYRIPFYAHAGRDYRFTSLNEKPERDLSGEWATLFGIDGDEPEHAIGEFRQNGNHLEGLSGPKRAITVFWRVLFRVVNSGFPVLMAPTPTYFQEAFMATHFRVNFAQANITKASGMPGKILNSNWATPIPLLH